ncbi:hypothetical protein LIA77_08445 [Sarocladium implicatum]|nr:hypothetical protein LIA77_08445 [Sarocladium implicatum]
MGSPCLSYDHGFGCVFVVLIVLSQTYLEDKPWVVSTKNKGTLAALPCSGFDCDDVCLSLERTASSLIPCS